MYPASVSFRFVSFSHRTVSVVLFRFRERDYCKQLKSARWRHYGPGPQQPLPAQALVEKRGDCGGVLTGESGVMVLVRVCSAGMVE